MSYKLPTELEKRAVREMARTPNNHGNFCNVWLFDNFAVRSPIDVNGSKAKLFSYEEWQKMFERAVSISEDLITRGVKTPKVYGVSALPEGRPFMVMEKLPRLLGFDILPPNDAKAFLNSYMRQREIIRKAGYEINDWDFRDSGYTFGREGSTLGRNGTGCGLNREDREVWFYDFDFWKKRLEK